jgi:hypothetical protein
MFFHTGDLPCLPLDLIKPASSTPTFGLPVSYALLSRPTLNDPPLINSDRLPVELSIAAALGAVEPGGDVKKTCRYSYRTVPRSSI